MKMDSYYGCSTRYDIRGSTMLYRWGKTLWQISMAISQRLFDPKRKNFWIPMVQSLARRNWSRPDEGTRYARSPMGQAFRAIDVLENLLNWEGNFNDRMGISECSFAQKAHFRFNLLQAQPLESLTYLGFTHVCPPFRWSLEFELGKGNDIKRQ